MSGEFGGRFSRSLCTPYGRCIALASTALLGGSLRRFVVRVELGLGGGEFRRQIIGMEGDVRGGCGVIMETIDAIKVKGRNFR